MKTAIILRGLPGSGKTTYARSLHPAKICSADSLFETKAGYHFDPSLLDFAHANCFYLYLRALEDQGQGLIVVDNTNCQPLEIAPYWMAARALGVNPMIHYVYTSVATALQRNIHHVPEPAIRKMEANLQIPIPARWKQLIIQPNFPSKEK